MNKALKILVYITLICGVIIIVFPFFWMISTSLKTLPEAIAVPPAYLPEKAQFINYRTALSSAPYLIYTLNSIFVALCTTIAVLITTVLAAFAFTRFEFRGKNLILALLIATLMIPGEMLIITNYQTMASLSLIDTRAALILPYMSSVFYIYLVMNFFISIPNELYLAAKVDGTSDLKYLWKVIVPISKPVLITVAILNIIGSWNAYLWPALIINSTSKRTLPFGLISYTSEAGTNYNLLMAASTIVIVPMIILFILSRKHVIGGLTKGAVKG